MPRSKPVTGPFEPPPAADKTARLMTLAIKCASLSRIAKKSAKVSVRRAIGASTFINGSTSTTVRACNAMKNRSYFRKTPYATTRASDLPKKPNSPEPSHTREEWGPLGL